jgi:hypothetical protein
MNLFNRVMTMLVLVAAWAIVVVLAAAPEQALAWAQAGLDWVQQSLAALAALQPAWLYPLLRVLTLVLATIVLLIMLWLEVRRRRTPVVRVQLPSGGEAAVTADSVARRLAWHIDQLADVMHVYPEVQARGSGVDVHLTLDTAPDVDIPMKTEEVIAITREIIEQHMGLQLRKVKVELRHTEFPEVVGGATTAAGSSSRGA